MPDEAARVELYRYRNPRIQQWPEAEFIVGNPPFIGGKDIRADLGDGYAEALWASRAKRKWVPNSADFVMYWWDEAAHALTAVGSKVRRFGFVTTNSITQTFSRRVIQHYLQTERPLSLAFAIPDHPWVKGEARAQVRIAMTVAHTGSGFGQLKEVTREDALDTDAPKVDLRTAFGRIHADLTVGANVSAAKPLMANDRIASPGVKLHGDGFIVSPTIANSLGLSTRPGLTAHIRPYLNGRDLTQTSRGMMVIDLWGLSEVDVRARYPEVYQHLLENVKPQRDATAARSQTRDAHEYAARWWTFGKPRQDLRTALVGLSRFIVTGETAKHRTFQFLDASVTPDNMLVCFGLDAAEWIAVLSSRFHETWSLAAGGWMGVGNDPRYQKSRCFDPFPFPDLAPDVRVTLSSLGEELDAFRKARQAETPGLTVTDMYNVLEKLRRDDPLSEDDKRIHEHGLISTLKRIHDQIDEAVAVAYGLPLNATDVAILDHLVALNRSRSDDEKRGLVRWLRPAFQNPTGAVAAPTVALELSLETDETEKRPAFPEGTGERARAVRAALITHAKPATPEEIARTFRQGARVKKSVADLLETMAALGQAEEREGKYFAPESVAREAPQDS